MPYTRFLLVLSISLLVPLSVPRARAGDEDVAEPKKKVEEKAPEDTALPKDVEAPEMAVGESSEPPPDFREVQPAKSAQERGKLSKPFDPDENINFKDSCARRYDRIYEGRCQKKFEELIEPPSSEAGVLPPAQGFRGYRPNMIALGFGDRTPGIGGLVEYNWNHIGAGVSVSYRSASVDDPNSLGYGIAGLYGLYRWLPFDISPYFLLGTEAGRQTDETLGGMLGLGIEARLYWGWTGLLGWTFHSTVHRGFLGVSFGWSF